MDEVLKTRQCPGCDARPDEQHDAGCHGGDKIAPERYRVEVRHRRGWLWEAQVVTTHVLPCVGEQGEPVEPLEVETRLFDPPARPGERWANWKGRRMVAAAYRRDVREQQPWAVQR